MADLATLGFLKNLREKYLEEKFTDLEQRFNDLERKMTTGFEKLSEKIDNQSKK